MASSLKRLVYKKISNAARKAGENTSLSKDDIMKSMYISKSKNDLLEINVPVDVLKNSCGNKFLSSVLSIEPDNTIEKVSCKSEKEATFLFNRTSFISNLLSKYTNEKVFLENLIKLPKKEIVVLEFSSPNIAKPFHLGHLRSTIIGNFIGNIYRELGHEVVKINYLGDWGTQFGMLSLGIKAEGLSEECIGKNPMNLLYSVYVKANKMASEDSSIADHAREIFCRLEKGAESEEKSMCSDARTDELKQWKVIRKYTENELSRMYNRLGVKFDEYAWESEYRATEISPLLSEMEKRGLLKMDHEGKKVVKIENIEKPVTLLKSDGSTLYLTRDVACAYDRHQRYNFDRMYYVVDSSQSNHFLALFSILEKLGLRDEVTKHPALAHVKFGRVRGMSTRKGTSVFLKDILDEAQSIMKEKILFSPNTKVPLELSEETADILGTSAVIINDLKQRRQKEYDFNWNKILQVDGDTGIKLQYTHCRLCNLEKNCGVELPSQCDSLFLPEPEITPLVKEIARYEDVLLKSYEELEACHLVVYLFQLCHEINRAFKVLKVKDQPESVGPQRLLLFHVSRLVLGHGMRTLGLKPLENM